MDILVPVMLCTPLMWPIVKTCLITTGLSVVCSGYQIIILTIKYFA